MKKLYALYLVLISFTAFGQEAAGPLKMDVPEVNLGANQNYQAISFEPLAKDKFSILYIQELAATVVGAKEFRSDKMLGAFADAETKKFVPYSERVLVLVRQTINKPAEPTIQFWVVGLRELQSDMKYALHFPATFVHPIIKEGHEVNYSLKNLEQINGLSPREFEAVVQLGKQRYGFYKYPEPTFSTKATTFKEEMAQMRSGLKEIGAVFGKGDIPKTEKLLFKRDMVDGIRIAGTRIDKKDSTEVKLYVSAKDDANYELIKKQTFFGSINSNLANTLVYDNSLKIAGAIGYMVLKYKDASGTAKTNTIIMGLNSNGDGQIWKLDIGKNSLNSFNPEFSHTDPNGLYVISTNNEKVFKPYYQYHFLKNDGTSSLLFPTSPADMNTEKFQYIYTDQVKNAGYATGQYTSESKEKIPVALYELHKNKYVITGEKVYSSGSGTTAISYTNLTVMRLDPTNKLKDIQSIQENKSINPVYPRMLGSYPTKTYFMVNYPNKFKLILSEDKIETEQSENNIFKLVYMPNEDYISANQFGNMILTKSIVGNKYLLEFYPGK